jgi:hypothetical protein
MRKSTSKRSPPYPAISLKEAVSLCKAFYKSFNTVPVPSQRIGEVYSSLGFRSPNGTAMRAVASLTAYGLIERRRSSAVKGVAVSDLGQKIILTQESDPSLPSLLQTAAMVPRVFESVVAEFSAELPKDDARLESFLAARGYLGPASKIVLRNLRETIDYAGFRKQPGAPDHKRFIIPLNEGREAVFTYPHNISAAEFQAIKTLMAALEASENSLRG